MLITRFKRALAANSTATSFASTPSATARPSGIDICAPGGKVAPWGVRLMPFGLGSSNDAFSMRVLGWNVIGDAQPQSLPLWISQPLVEIACTVGAATGVAGSPVLATELFVDTIAPVALKQPTINAGAATEGKTFFYSPADDTAAYIDVPLVGSEIITFLWDQTTNTPEMNTLYRFLWERP